VGKKADDEGKGLGGLSSPVFENLDPAEENGAVAGGKFSGGLQHQLDPGVPAVQVRLDAFLDQADDQLAQFGLSAEKFPAISRVKGYVYSTDIVQKLEALSPRTAAAA